MQIVTTLPSATELVVALGLEPAGVSHECDWPPRVESVPSITQSRIDTDGSSGEIDQQVLDAAGNDESDATGTGVYDIDTDTLAALDPNLVITQGMCDVCAIDDIAIADALESIPANPDLLTTDPHSMADVFSDLERIGRAVGREERAAEVRAELESRIDRVRERTRDCTPQERPRVAIFDWTDPVMVAGHWTAELVDWAGGEYGLAAVGERSRPREWDEIREYDPECIVMAPCGFGLDQTAANVGDLSEREGWDELTAVQNDRVWAMDGNHYLNRPGPRLVDTLEALAPVIRPELFGDSSDPAPADEFVVPLDALETDRAALQVES
ncbi:ABC transporter substrate-binding protein [Natrialba sp. SSL1]|uniref:ABC transporter substrate-binding protein n=1 Tax=Natrialba sp. SSL1 TaxID=1869245 RepID=UPI0008F8C487|nr:ABC transporter substrate-binding protein [Natrialba sp. SSL1]OIB58530.1 cobalamin-binding protein [Natrialba sp. SSL1]